jgi:hypothetical protein
MIQRHIAADGDFLFRLNEGQIRVGGVHLYIYINDNDNDNDHSLLFNPLSHEKQLPKRWKTINKTNFNRGCNRTFGTMAAQPYTIKWGILATGGIAQSKSYEATLAMQKSNTLQRSPKISSPTLPLAMSATFTTRW